MILLPTWYTETLLDDETHRSRGVIPSQSADRMFACLLDVCACLLGVCACLLDACARLVRVPVCVCACASSVCRAPLLSRGGIHPAHTHSRTAHAQAEASARAQGCSDALRLSPWYVGLCVRVRVHTTVHACGEGCVLPQLDY